MSDGYRDDAKTWVFGSDRVHRTVAFDEARGIRTTSFVNPASGREFAGADPESVEFLMVINGERISGADAGLVLRDVREDGRAGSTKTLIELERDGLLIELSYLCYEGMPVIRKGIRLKNITGDRSFEIEGLFASERLALARYHGPDGCAGTVRIESHDEGRTWSEPAHLFVGAMDCLRNLPGGGLMVSHVSTSGIVVRFSYDGGWTWTRELWVYDIWTEGQYRNGIAWKEDSGQNNT